MAARAVQTVHVEVRFEDMAVLQCEDVGGEDALWWRRWA